MQWSFNALDNTECINLFRFAKVDLVLLKRCLRLPELIRLENRCQMDGMLAFCITLRRLVYPARWVDLEYTFHLPVSTLSRAFHIMMMHLYVLVHDRMRWDSTWLTPDKLEEYAAANYEAGGCSNYNDGSPCNDIWGWLDGTLRECARPVRSQRQAYSGMKHKHGYKWQAIMAPDGLFAHFYGPFSAKRHDMRMVEICELLVQHAHGHEARQLVVYADKGYTPCAGINCMYRRMLGVNVPDNQAALSAQRVCVEWGFGHILGLWNYMDGRTRLKSLQQPICIWYEVAAFLTNCHVCVHGSLVTSHFHCALPLLEDYCNRMLALV